MAKTYYTLDEAQQRLGMTEEQVRQLVRDGRLREFRDAGKLHYKAEDVDALAAEVAAQRTGSGEVVLEPGEGTAPGLSGSGPGLASSGSGPGLTGSSDMVTLEEAEPAEPGEPKKDDTVVTSVGISVFDDEDLEVEADPLAKTILSADEAATLDSAGSGSGLLDLTRESDDTSLGAELLEEIYSGEEEVPQLGDATRAGLEEEVAAEETGGEEAFVGPAPPAYVPAAGVEDDPVAPAFTGVMVVTTIVLGLAGAVAAAMIRGVWPAYLQTVYANVWYFLGGSVLLAGIVLVVGLLVGKQAVNRRAAMRGTGT